MINEYNHTRFEEPESHKFFWWNKGGKTNLCVRKGDKYYKLTEIISNACKCPVGHELVEIKKEEIKAWKYPLHADWIYNLYEEFLL